MSRYREKNKYSKLLTIGESKQNSLHISSNFGIGLKVFKRKMGHLWGKGEIIEHF